MKQDVASDAILTLRGSPVLKALRLIEGVAGLEKAVTLAELSMLLGLPKPTVHRLAQQLEHERYLERDPVTRRFTVGRRMIDLATATLGASLRQGPRRAILRQLTRETGETSTVGVMVMGEVHWADWVHSDHMGLSITAVLSDPLHCTAVGRLFLAYMPCRRRERYLRAMPLVAQTEKTITDPVRLAEEIKRVRAENLAVNDEQGMMGVVSIAVPVTGANRHMYAGVGVSTPKARMSAEQVRAHIPALRRAAERLAVIFQAQDAGAEEIPDAAD